MTDEPEAIVALDANTEEERQVPEQPWWDVPAALAWILYRDRGFSDFITSSGGIMSTHLAGATVIDRRPSQCSEEDAEERLIEALKAPQLIALGVPLNGPASGRGHIEIPSSDWPFMRFRNHPVIAAPKPGLRDVFTKRYGLIILRADDVMRLWPSTIEAEGENPTVAAAKRATKTLVTMLLANPDMTLQGAMQICCPGFGVSQRQVRSDVWPNAREEAGLPRKAPPGRKPKR
jgi:hypothetical protein